MYKVNVLIKHDNALENILLSNILRTISSLTYSTEYQIPNTRILDTKSWIRIKHWILNTSDFCLNTLYIKYLWSYDIYCLEIRVWPYGLVSILSSYITKKNCRTQWNTFWSIEDQKICWYTPSIMQHCIQTKHNRKMDESQCSPLFQEKYPWNH